MIKTDELDQLFDQGEEDILQHFDISTARRPEPQTKRVNADLPQRMIDSVD